MIAYDRMCQPVNTISEMNCTFAPNMPPPLPEEQRAQRGQFIFIVMQKGD